MLKAFPGLLSGGVSARFEACEQNSRLIPSEGDREALLDLSLSKPESVLFVDAVFLSLAITGDSKCPFLVGVSGRLS